MTLVCDRDLNGILLPRCVSTGPLVSENKLRVRAKAIFPTVLLTLLSIVQALALELMWAHVTEESYLYSWSFVAVLSWLQISASFLGILLIWLVYSDMVLRLSWVPNTADAVFPFFIGIMEFAQMSVLGPTTIGVWFIILSAIFGTMVWISHLTMRRARKETDNHDFFDGVEPATARDHLISAIPVVVLFALGLGLLTSANQGWFAGAALIVVNAILGYQILLNHRFSQRSYRQD